MTQDKLEKWQIALNHWNTWVNCVKEARATILKRYDNLADIIVKAKLELPDTKTNNITSIDDITPIGNQEALILWRLYDEAWEFGKEFITKHIGSSHFEVWAYSFIYYWLYSVIPEIAPDPNGKFNLPDEELTALLYRPIWFNSVAVGKGNKKRIIDSVSWYRGKVKTNNIANILPKIKWPSAKSTLRKDRGGRPPLSILDSSYSEAIVCYILNKKQRLPQKAIANLFGWKTHRDSYDNWMSNTVRSRVKLGKRLLHITERKNITNK